MNIVFFIGSLGNGGAERVISILANYYASKKWNVDIALLLKTEIGYELNKNINIIDLTSKDSSYIKSIIPWMIKIRKYIKKHRPDKIISFVGRINMLVLLSTIGINIPIIVSERNDPRNDGRSTITQLLINLCYLRANKIIFQTQYQQKCFSDKLKHISEIIPNPIDVDEAAFSIQCKEPATIVTVGRYSEQKNHMFLMKAVNELRKEIPDIKLELYGDGELRKTYAEYISTNNLQSIILLKGVVKDVHIQIRKSSIFIMTSKYEGMSNALLEAQMLGMPCIVADYPGVQEVIQDGYNGIIIQQNNQNELCEMIKKCINDKAFSKSIGDNAHQSSLKYKKDNVIMQWEKAIES